MGKTTTIIRVNKNEFGYYNRILFTGYAAQLAQTEYACHAEGSLDGT